MAEKIILEITAGDIKRIIERYYRTYDETPKLRHFEKLFEDEDFREGLEKAIREEFYSCYSEHLNSNVNEICKKLEKIVKEIN